MPNEAMMAPPGTPGAATMEMPNIMMNPENMAVSYGKPSIIMIVRAQATIFNALPDMCIVAHSGTVKPAMFYSG